MAVHAKSSVNYTRELAGIQYILLIVVYRPSLLCTWRLPAQVPRCLVIS